MKSKVSMLLSIIRKLSADFLQVMFFLAPNHIVYYGQCGLSTAYFYTNEWNTLHHT